MPHSGAPCHTESVAHSLVPGAAQDGGTEADAHTLAALVLLEDLVARGGRSPGRPPLHVLGAVRLAAPLPLQPSPIP